MKCGKLVVIKTIVSSLKVKKRHQLWTDLFAQELLWRVSY